MTALLLAGALLAPPPAIAGSDVFVDKPVRGPVVAMAASVHVAADVDGDVVALAGDVMLDPGVRVSGDVVALGGRVTGTGRAQGRIVALSAWGGAGGPGAGRASGLAGWGLLLVRAGVWTLLATLLVAAGPRVVRRCGQQINLQPVRTLLIGVLVLALWLVSAVIALALLATPFGVVLLIAEIFAFVVAKLMGVVTAAWVAGNLLARFLPVEFRGEIPRTGVAMLLLAAVSALPLVGGGLWVLANVAGIGALGAAVLDPKAAPLLAAAR